jgi:NADH:ubiquinone oxidoreductase subunit 6 (subunit J)
MNMDDFKILGTVAQYGFMFAILATAVVTVTTRNLFHAAIFLAFTLIGVAILYFFLHAEYIGAVQILLYVGAIMVLVIFAIMLTGRLQDPNVRQSNHQGIPVFAVLLGVAAFLIPIIVRAPWSIAKNAQNVSVVQLGKALMGDFVFPFEVVSLVLLVALIGAIVTARGD